MQAAAHVSDSLWGVSILAGRLVVSRSYGVCMPRRTNHFQEVVAIIHKHMSGDATVQESAMLVSRATDAEREVDVSSGWKLAG